MATIKKNKILVCGAGSIGKRHIENLIIFNQKVIVWRERKEKNNEILKKYKIPVTNDLESAIKDSDAIIIANATDKHLKIINKAIKYKKNMYIEKPISNSMRGVKSLINNTKKLKVEVGFQLRNHPNLVFLRKIINRSKLKSVYYYRFSMGYRLDLWRKRTDYRKSYTSDHSRGGGALFELIHQIDLAIWMFGPIKSFKSYQTNIGPFKIKGDDLTHLILIHENGISGQIVVDMVNPVYKCDAEIVTNKSVYTWNYTDGNIKRKFGNKEKVIHSVTKSFNRNKLFKDHMHNFLKMISKKTNTPPICKLNDAIESLEIASKVKKVSKKSIYN